MGCDRLPTDLAPPERPFKRGVTLVDWTTNGYAARSSQDAIAEISATGASHLTIVVTGYQTTKTSNTVFLDRRRSPTPSAVRRSITWGQAMGMEIVLKIHVLPMRSMPGEVDPSNVELWFDSYISFLSPWAELAESTGAAQFVVGTELKNTIEERALWLETIASVRAVFSGELTYAASWDEVFSVGFWQDLDFVGVDFYFPVTSRKDPGRFEILAGWQPWLQKLERLHRHTDRDIVFTEIGYRSIDGAGMIPYQFGISGPLDLQEQADLYWAALQSTADISWISGIFWWNWLANNSGGMSNRDYTPKGKPAEAVLTSAWSRE